MKKFLRTTAFVFGIFYILVGLFAPRLSIISFGTALCLALGLVLVVYAVFDRRFDEKILWRILRALLLVGVVCYAAIMGVIVSAAKDTAKGNENVIIVLGAQINGKAPTKPLRYRLDRAVFYAEENPDAYIMVSGGQGENEVCPEAVAMEQYLINKGVDGHRIMLESKSTSTYENFAFSKKILDRRFGEGKYTVCFVTNNFHCYRAAALAKKAGFNDITSISADLGFIDYIPQSARECLAVLNLWVFE